MATIFNAISVVSAVIGFVGFAQNNLPSNKPSPMDSFVRIAVALNGDKGVPGALRHAAGNAPLVQAFNENLHFCGTTYDDYHPYIRSGSFLDMTIHQSEFGPGEQATSLQVIPTTNELCIAYIGQTWADGSHRGWTGDMGKGCDRDWYYSNVIVGNDHKPTCTWVDNDHSHGITTAALQIRMQDFTNITGEYNKDPAFYCRHPTMLFKSDAGDYRWARNSEVGEFVFWDATDPSASTSHLENDGVGPKDRVGKPPSRRRRRSDLGLTLRRRSSGSAAFSHLIASPHDRHSAKELCEHDMSHGPDFVSFSEGVFCDMDTKMHWPLCNGTTTTGGEGCYHWDTHSLVLGGGRLARNYSRVEEWE